MTSAALFPSRIVRRAVSHAPVDIRWFRSPAFAEQVLALVTMPNNG